MGRDSRGQTYKTDDLRGRKQTLGVFVEFRKDSSRNSRFVGRRKFPIKDEEIQELA